MPLLLSGHAACRTRIHVSALLASPAPQPRKAEAVSTQPEAGAKRFGLRFSLRVRLTVRRGSLKPAMLVRLRHPEPMAADPYLSEYVRQALVELTRKSLQTIQLETAMVWYGRAVAAVQLGKPADAIEYAHESIEHAALAGDVGLLEGIRAGLRRHGLAL